MDKEVREQGKLNKKRRVSLFRRRKKPQIRQAVSHHQSKSYTKLITNIIFFILGIFILVTALFIVRKVLLPKLFIHNTLIISPQGNLLPDNNQIENILRNSGLSIDSIKFSTRSSEVTFTMHKSTFVRLSKDKNISSQLDLVEAIDKQISEDGKQAIYIDLRYNKPIVKFE